MLSSKTVFVSDIGEVLLYKSKKSKRVSIRVSAQGTVKVSVPWLASYDYAVTFLHDKKDWVIQAILKIEKRNKNNTASIFTDCDNITLFHHLRLVPWNNNSIQLSINENIIKVMYPETISTTDNQVQSVIKKGLLFAMQKEAKQYLPKRIKELSAQTGLLFNKICIRDTTSRWGSCSGKNNINLSIRLMKLPQHLIDYVILHELAHVKHKNHSNNFWLFLDSICKNSKLYSKELKNYSTIV